MNENTIEKINAIDPNEMSWTKEELDKWVKAGLVPLDLLDKTRSIELCNFLIKNKEILYKNYRRKKNNDDNRYEMTVPPPNEWHTAPDIKVTDRKTGEISILEMGGYFELCEGVCLRIKAKELKDWEKETADVRKLNKEQHETFKAALEKIGPDKPLTRKEIVTLIEEVRKPQKSKTFRQSREIIDNKLDRFQSEKLITLDVSDQSKPIIKGLDLDQAEDRIVHTLTLLLSRKSENTNQNSADYYMGNHGKGVVSIYDTEMETARIIITPHELYSTYYGKENYGSDQISFILNKLDSLSKKVFLTTWNIPNKSNKSSIREKKYDKFRTYLPLFQIAILNQDLSESESQEIDNNKSLLEGKKCHFLFKFQPQFTNNIRERYVEFPENIYQRITEAAGKDRFGQCINLMRDFLFREKQALNRRGNEIVRDKETMINILKLDKFWREGRKKKVNEMIKECFEIFSKINLIKEWEEIKGVKGQDQFRIIINRDFK